MKNLLLILVCGVFSISSAVAFTIKNNSNVKISYEAMIPGPVIAGELNMTLVGQNALEPGKSYTFPLKKTCIVGVGMYKSTIKNGKKAGLDMTTEEGKLKSLMWVDFNFVRPSDTITIEKGFLKNLRKTIGLDIKKL